MHQCAHPPYLVVSLSGINYINYVTCIQIHLIPQFGLNAALVSLCVIAVDRVLSVLLPTQ